MNKARLLLCDDQANVLKKYPAGIEKAWAKLAEKNALFAKSVKVEVCPDIIDQGGKPPGMNISEVGAFDALLLDIAWGDDNRPHGIDIATLVRKRFPELPIIILSERATPEHFGRLIPLGISGYISKNSRQHTDWCVTIDSALERAFYDRSGLPLYRILRQVLAEPGSWEAEIIGEAASEVWKQENSHQKWRAFWGTVSNHLASKHILFPVKEMAGAFANSDLFTLGLAPAMRGHLDHVLNVYFTGYVLSHKLPDVRKAVIGAVKRLVPGESIRPEKSWDVFQLVWLATACLHDTGYSLEVLPDVGDRCSAIQKLFPFVSFSPGSVAMSGAFDWKQQPGEVAKQAFQGVLARLYPKQLPVTWIEDNASFNDGKHLRLNHGVVSGAKFVSEASKWTGQDAKDTRILTAFLEWAGTAMALHSLKHPGKSSNACLSLMNDPLSFLLLLCDELQVWNRERPDQTQETSAFRRIELENLALSEREVEATIRYIPFAGIQLDRKVHINPLVERIEKDRQILKVYLKSDPVKVKVQPIVQGWDKEPITPLEL